MSTPTSTSNSLERRQLWALPTPTDIPPTSGLCKSLTLPSGGFIVLDNSSTVTFTSNVVYQPPCTGSPALVGGVGNSTQPIDEFRDPFYASVTPLVYIVALTTVIAWFLLIILLLLPGSYFNLSSNPLTRGWRRGDGLRNMFTYPSSPFPIGYRPWLQRFAALMVVIALTTVTTDTFRHAEEQYIEGYSDAAKLRDQVTGSLKVRVIRVISDLFLWLAQIQTLVRLFPRRKEKLVIKWVGFVIILCDIIFSCLNSFLIDHSTYDNRPRSYRDAIPALSYLFQFALNLLYAAWVGYYALTKRRYAFYHHLMPEICIVALISTLSLLIPVVFFLVDILKSDVGAWGDYFRWVASAAASIVVWEWVERIELLEREEKKDGILGREIFEEDDIADDSTPFTSRRPTILNTQEKDIGPGRRGRALAGYHRFENAMRRVVDTDLGKGAAEAEKSDSISKPKPSFRRRKGKGQAATDRDQPPILTVPKPALSPVDRVDAISPSSTVYTVRYHPTTQTPPVDQLQQGRGRDRLDSVSSIKVHNVDGRDTPNLEANDAYEPPVEGNKSKFPGRAWIAHAFHRSRNSPPAEVKKALSLEQQSEQSTCNASRPGVSKFINVLGVGTNASQTGSAVASAQPTVIPPPTSNQPWTPDRIRHETVNDDPLSPATESISQIEPVPPNRSARYDFASQLEQSADARATTPAETLSGTTAMNTSSPSDGTTGSGGEATASGERLSPVVDNNGTTQRGQYRDID